MTVHKDGTVSFWVIDRDVPSGGYWTRTDWYAFQSRRGDTSLREYARATHSHSVVHAGALRTALPNSSKSHKDSVRGRETKTLLSSRYNGRRRAYYGP